MLDISTPGAKTISDTLQAQTEAPAQAESETAQMDEILKVFRDLGLEDANTRESFRRFAEPSDWHTWQKPSDIPQDTKSNTRS